MQARNYCIVTIMFHTIISVLLLALWGVAAPAGPALAASAPQPYAANLFQGHFSQAKDAKDTSVIMPGDRVVPRLWGGDVRVDQTLAVADDGHLDVPQVGAIPVAGLGYDKLAEALRSKLAAAGHGDVQIYAAPLDARPVAVFVTGGVQRPGRYTGTPGDPLLSFLDKAGGLDPVRGSYRGYPRSLPFCPQGRAAGRARAGGRHAGGGRQRPQRGGRGGRTQRGAV